MIFNFSYCYFILTKISTVNRYWYCNFFFLKQQSKPHFENACRHSQRAAFIVAGGSGGDHVTPCLWLPLSPGKCFSAWWVLCHLPSHLSRLMLNHLLFPTLLCVFQPPSTPKPNGTTQEFPESSTVSCLWALV